jgi:hypothetical protein
MKSGSISQFDPGDDDDAASTLVLELMQFTEEFGNDFVEESSSSNNTLKMAPIKLMCFFVSEKKRNNFGVCLQEEGVVVCWSCSEVYAASAAVCSFCGDGPL